VRTATSLSRAALHQKQVHDVGAGDQKNKSDCAEQNKQSAAQAGCGGILKSLHQDAKSLMGIGISDCFLLIEPSDFLLRLRKTDPRLEPGDGHERVMNVLGQVVVKLAQGHPQIGPAQKLKTGRQNAHDGVALVVEGDGAADNGRIAAKPALPKTMPQDHYWRVAGAVLLRDEGAARDDACSQHRKEVRAGIPNQDALRLAIARQVEAF
jgi:hypothetical protein